MEVFFIFILGLIVGSFLNVLVLRWNTGRSAIIGRSRCFSCGKTLRWFELIPVLSFVLQCGRCRSCRSRISIQYPLVEFSTALLFYLLYGKWAAAYAANLWNVGILAWWLVFWSAFLALVVYDMRHKILPDALSYFLTLWSVAGVAIYGADTAIRLSFICGVALFLFFAALWLVSRGRWMGLGDAKLFGGVGIFLGWPNALLALFFSFWIGSIISIIGALWRGRFDWGRAIPFAPFIFLGALSAFLWGSAVYYWYFNVLI